MIIMAISDTHRTEAEHNPFLSTGGDLLIYAGDADVDDYTGAFFLNWCKKVSKDFKHGMILIGGNHDQYLYDNEQEVRDSLRGTAVHYLVNQEVVIAGIRIFGSPYSVLYGDQFTAFAMPEKKLKNEIWNQIPVGLDILITHTPPAGALESGIGSQSLATAVGRAAPRLQICGHIHRDHGSAKLGETMVVNVASLATIDRVNNATIIEYDEVAREVISISPSEMNVT
jgi:Icc-related predicted phosphoesterase